MKGSLEEMPFRRLVETNTELVELRQEYAGQTENARCKAALFNYDASVASDIFQEAISRLPGAGVSPGNDNPGWGAVIALAIDPACAPAMLTVGSVEYQFGRPEEAMIHFLALAALPGNTEELPEIIDEAGEFLLDQQDYTRARTLYAEAARRHETVPLYHNALGYCASKLGEMRAAVDHSRRAVELAPENCRFLSDLGWSLVEAESYDEAEEVLLKAVNLSPKDPHQAKENLLECRRRRQKRGEK